jgi:hypothetical protein
VREAIEIVEPFGVDVCNGVRSNGRLDAEKLTAFSRLYSNPSPTSPDLHLINLTGLQDRSLFTYNQ